ncbi:acetate--CoA ligase family protein [Hyalangium rubrum]|uniref:Acetate--CoA ligase family protein n=1 Tax=Hyalangium rubrum TaxID=3103134 RepID=A0ABU5H7Q6_9BACT|nr:acetate--CoA ligase family protein [Hyalangium sp. s54d21]MDY7229490.1 acetate--CoA ligase family protein [Hyalangium sp. s54d21]
MSAHDAIAALLMPTEVAVYRAQDLGAYGSRVVTALRHYGYTGHIWTPEERLPDEARPSAAVVTVPLGALDATLEDAARHGARVAVIGSSGFVEAGPENLVRRYALKERARALGMRLVGPASIGAVNVHGRVALSNSAVLQGPLLREGAVSLFGQGGSLIGTLLELGRAQGIGFRYAVSLGVEVDLSLADFVGFALEDPDTRAVAVVVEQPQGLRRLGELATRARQLGKSVVVLLLGRSQAAAEAVRGHTGALSGHARAQEAWLRAHGAVVVGSAEELVHVSATLAMGRFARGPRLALWSGSGGMNALLADLAAERGLPLAKPDPLSNPHDAGSARELSRDALAATASTLDAHPGVDVVLLGLGSSPAIAQSADGIAAAARNIPWVVYAPGNAWPEARDALRRARIAVIPDGRYALRCVEALIERGRSMTPPEVVRSPPVVSVQGQHGVLDELASRQLLQEAGLSLPAVAVARYAEEAVAHAERFGFPVALKRVSASVTHKAAEGFVRLELADPLEVRAAFAALAASRVAEPPRVTVAPMVHGIEVLLGARRERELGWVVVLAAGGLLAERLDDAAWRVPPFTEEQAREAFLSLRLGARLQAFGDLDALASFAAAFSRVVAALPEEGREVDLNPVVVRPPGRGLNIIDARVRLADLMP